jgi:hypothetical protein
MIQVPTWRIDGMTFPGQHKVDDQGREWVILRDGETGWQGSPGARTDRTDRPYSHGAFRGAAFRKERILTLKGRVWCPDEDSREETERELSALCSDPAQLYEYRRTTDRYDQVVHVELDDEVLISNPVGVLRLDFSYQFAAPDPRIFDYSWQEPISTVAVSSVDGVDWFTDVDWSTGLDFGFSTTASSLSKVANYGTAPAFPLFRLKGPLANPGIFHVESGVVIRYNSQIAEGEYVVINCDTNPQRGWDGHTCYSTLRGNVRSLLTRIDWPVVDPQTVATFQLQATGSSNSELMTQLRSAYW